MVDGKQYMSTLGVVVAAYTVEKTPERVVVKPPSLIVVIIHRMAQLLPIISKEEPESETISADHSKMRMVMRSSPTTVIHADDE